MPQVSTEEEDEECLANDLAHSSLRFGSEDEIHTPGDSCDEAQHDPETERGMQAVARAAALLRLIEGDQGDELAQPHAAAACLIRHPASGEHHAHNKGETTRCEVSPLLFVFVVWNASSRRRLHLSCISHEFTTRLQRSRWSFSV